MLGPTGAAIWAAFQADKLDQAAQALVREYARCADTLDKIDGLVRAKQSAWAMLVFDDMGEVHLEINRILDEQRKTQVVLKTLAAEIRQAGIKAGGGSASQTKEADEGDMLAQRRADKERREQQHG